MIERFLRSGRSGFYFSVEQEGEVAVGDSFKFLSRDSSAITIAEMNRLFAKDKYDYNLLQKVVNTSALPENWREYFAARGERPVAKA
jgi:MOSC domain-containing protein YiiM